MTVLRAPSHSWRRRSRPSPVAALLLAACALILLLLSPSSHNVVGVASAFDLGKAFGGGGTKKTKEESQEVKDAKKLVANHAANDASTGTITEFHPGQEREPVTCNEIMAKAVVTASEEKAAAITERDAALRAAATMTERSNELEEALNEAEVQVEEMRRRTASAEAKAEAETLALKTVADQAKSEANATISATKIETDAKLHRMIAEHAETTRQLKAELETQLETERRTASELTTKALLDADAKIEEMKVESERNVAAAHETIAKIRTDCEEERKAAVTKINDECQKTIDDVNALMDAVRRNANDDVAEAKRQQNEAIETAKAMAESAQTIADGVVSTIRAEAEANVTAAHRRTQEEIERIQQGCQRSIEDVNALLETVRRNAANDLQTKDEELRTRLAEYHREAERAKTAVEVERMTEKNEYENQIQRLEQEHEEWVTQSTKDEMTLRAKLKEAERTTKELTEIVDEYKKEIKHWEDTHKSQGYCNYTLIRQHSAETLTGAAVKATTAAKTLASGAQTRARDVAVGAQSRAREAAAGASSRAVGAASRAAVVAEPHVSWLRELYNEHFKETVEAKVLPLYNEHVAPVTKAAMKTGKKVATQLKDLATEAHSRMVQAVEESSRITMKFIDEKDRNGAVPESVTDAIRYMGENAKEVVDFKLKLAAILLVLLFRSFIFRTLRMIVTVPFRIFWFFCPLRFFVGTKKESIATEETASDDTRSKETQKQNGEKKDIKEESSSEKKRQATL